MLKMDPNTVVFVMDRGEIAVNRALLRHRSPVFEKMLYGELAESRIRIPDIALGDFAQMLQFIRAGAVEITSVHNAWSLFYIANKYLLQDFEALIVNYIKDNLTITNLLLNYEYSEMFAVKTLARQCLNDISVYARGVFNHSLNDYHMKPSTLLTILSQCPLNITAHELLASVLEWTVTDLELSNSKITPLTIIELLKSAKILGYLSYDRAPFTLSPLLSTTYQLMKTMNANNLPLKPYMEKHWHTFCLSRHAFKISKRIDLRHGEAFLSQLIVSKNIILFGVVLLSEVERLGSRPDKYNGAIEIGIYVGDTCIVKTQVSKQFPYETPVYVPLSELIQLDGDKPYFMIVKYTNFDHYHEGFSNIGSILCSYMSCKNDDKNVTFKFNEFDGSIIRGLCFYPV